MNPQKELLWGLLPDRQHPRSRCDGCRAWFGVRGSRFGAELWVLGLLGFQGSSKGSLKGDL